MGEYIREISHIVLNILDFSMEHKTKILYIVRHGERIDDVDHTWEKSAERPFDPPLTKTGIEQAKKTGEKLKSLLGNADVKIFCSPFLRTIQTASAIASALEKRIHLEPGLTEWLGARWFNKMPDFIIPEEHKDLIVEDYMPFYTLSYPETLEDLIGKYYASALYIATKHEGSHNILVTHGYGVQFITEQFAQGAHIIHTPYCCITKLVLHEKGKWVAEMIADDSHLKS